MPPAHDQTLRAAVFRAATGLRGVAGLFGGAALPAVAVLAPTRRHTRSSHRRRRGPGCRTEEGRCHRQGRNDEDSGSETGAAQASAMKSLTGVDAAFLHLETPETPMHVGSVSLFDLPPRYRRDFHAEVRRALARRLHLAPVLHRKLAPMPLQFANPVWVDDDAVDLDHHCLLYTSDAADE